MKQHNVEIFHRVTGLWLLITLLLLTGCSNRFEEQLRETHKAVSSSLSDLKNQLDEGQLTNALLINKYATALRQQKPDYVDISTLLKKEGTPEGKAYTALTTRLAAVNLDPTSSEAAAASLQELQLIQVAADPLEFNNSLADVVNTLASLSDGQLAVINVPASQRASAQQNNALVGNPAYGNWQQNSSGQSFWAWYGMYSMFSNVMGMNRYNYGSWSSRPHYSYYGNYGRNRWGSGADVNKNYGLSQRYPGKYNKPSAATRSRYAATSSRSSSYGGSSSKSSSKSSSSRYSSYSSSRSSSYSNSRSFRSGK
ncbi:MAG: hypothetical protein GXP18_08675 [Gammaproteobacteria bacterium]|nr:hypothetical protein [Gammaproteobacteria bacterium]